MNNHYTEIIQIKSARNFMSFYFAFVISMPILIAINVLIEAQNVYGIISCVLLLVIGTLGIRLFLWLACGKEKVYLSNHKLICEKTGTFFIKTKEINVNDILKINICYSFIEEQQGFDGFKGLVTEFSYQMPRFKIQNTGRIELVLKDHKTFRMLNGLSVAEGKELIDKINRLLKNE